MVGSSSNALVRPSGTHGDLPSVGNQRFNVFHGRTLWMRQLAFQRWGSNSSIWLARCVGTVPDHIVPLWKGGLDEEGHLQPLCQSHHNVKTAAEAEKRVRGV